MSTIIALRGRRDSGKTTTIRLLHNLLSPNGYQIVRSDFKATGGDFIAVFTKNGKRIGVTSSGDTYGLVRNKLKELENDNCEICVCACRKFDRVTLGTNAAIKQFVNYSHQFAEKTLDYNSTTQQATNMSDARSLLKIIDSLI